MAQNVTPASRIILRTVVGLVATAAGLFALLFVVATYHVATTAPAPVDVVTSQPVAPIIPSAPAAPAVTVPAAPIIPAVPVPAAPAATGTDASTTTAADVRWHRYSHAPRPTRTGRY